MSSEPAGFQGSAVVSKAGSTEMQCAAPGAIESEIALPQHLHSENDVEIGRSCPAEPIGRLEDEGQLRDIPIAVTLHGKADSEQIIIDECFFGRRLQAF